jgi:hypothetical protein
MSAWQKACKFWYHLLCFVILALSVLILGVILFWTLEHTDIVAFVTVLLAAVVLEAILILSLFKATSIHENNVEEQRAGTGMSLRLILAKMAMLPKLVQKS